MIINTGARTDIPAFFSAWLLNRIRAGFVYVRNPFDRKRITRYSLTPDVVDCLVFCTKNPGPMLPRLHELDAFASYWFVTITPYEHEVEPDVPPPGQVIDSFRRLSDEIGRQRICWRYDPIFISERYSIERHIEAFNQMAHELSGYTNECVISFIDLYEKTRRNFPEVREVEMEEMIRLAGEFSRIGRQNEIKIRTCAEATDLSAYGIEASGCITYAAIERAIGAKLKRLRGKPVRPHCGCIPNRDIGAYNTCPHGCRYCYANYDQKCVQRNLERHDPDSPLLIGYPEASDIIKSANQESLIDRQASLF